MGSGACEASHEARRLACSRSVPREPGTPEPKSRVPWAAHRRSDDHCSGAETPRAVAALTARRARSAVSWAYPHSASAYPMASSVYRSARPTPRGTTTSTAPQDRQRYRRATTVVDVGASPGKLGPSTSRLRSPWPTTPTARPGSWPAPPQAGHLAGRTAAQDGGPSAQNLTSSPDWMMRVSLRWIVVNCLRRSAAGERCSLHRPPPFCPSTTPGRILRRALYDAEGSPGQKRASSARAPPL